MKECRNHGFCTPMMVYCTGCKNAILLIINSGKNCYIKESIQSKHAVWPLNLLFDIWGDFYLKRQSNVFTPCIWGQR